MTDWQTIDTAPKDGTEVLCHYGQAWGGETVVLAWFKDWNGKGNGAWVREGDNDYADPSHWMPLPEPPKEEES